MTLAEGFPDAASREPDPRVSLREAFAHGSKIVDLRCYPHERIALMRLLICIAQRALNGPDDENDWKSCKHRVAQAALAYLEEQKDCFNLFGDGPRFLQAHGTGAPGQMSAFRMALVDKDASVLFDRHVRPGARLAPHELAVALVTFQSFAACGETGGSETSPSGETTKSGRVKRALQSGETALCRDGDALHAFLMGANLVDTIHWNLICRSQLGGLLAWDDEAKPVWEYKQVRLCEIDVSKIRASYLGRLAPLGRAVWANSDCQVADVANGLPYGVFADSKNPKTKKIKPGTYIREPTASICPGNSSAGKPRLVSASAGGGLPKAAWRELHSIAVLGRSATRGGPLALEHLRTVGAQEATLWCGALVGHQAKVGDVVESSFRLPIEFIGDAGDSDSTESDPRKRPGPNQTYRQGVKLADEWSSRLQAAVQAYYFALQGKDLAGKAKNHAASRFWTALEQAAGPVLLYDVALHSVKYFSDGRRWIEESPWGCEVKRAAWDAYNFACPHTTPRQLRAYAAGSEKLAPKNGPKSRSRGVKEGNDSAEGDEL